MIILRLEFCTIASGSSGNCTYIGSDHTKILIDAGISGKKIEEGLAELKTGNLFPCPFDDRKEFQEDLRRINQAFGNSFRESISMTGELYSLLALLVGGSSRDRTARGRDAETVRSAVQFIEQRYSYAISVEDVADYVGVSRSTLFRVFTRQMGLSPKEYLYKLAYEGLEKRNLQAEILGEKLDTAKYKELIRVPGIGLKSARRITHMQKEGKKITSLKQLQDLGANVNKCKIFVKTGKSYQSTLI